MNMLYTSVHGDPSHPTILFLHGGGGAGWMWQPQVEALKEDYYLLVPDLPEHGRSASIKPFTISGSADSLQSLSVRRPGAAKPMWLGFRKAPRSPLPFWPPRPNWWIMP